MVKESPLSGQNIWKYIWLLSVWKERCLEGGLYTDLRAVTNRLDSWSGTWKDKIGRLVTKRFGRQECGWIFRTRAWRWLPGHPPWRRYSTINWIRRPILWTSFSFLFQLPRCLLNRPTKNGYLCGKMDIIYGCNNMPFPHQGCSGCHHCQMTPANRKRQHSVPNMAALLRDSSLPPEDRLIALHALHHWRTVVCFHKKRHRFICFASKVDASIIIHGQKENLICCRGITVNILSNERKYFTVKRKRQRAHGLRFQRSSLMAHQLQVW